MARIEISPEYDLKSIAEAAGQPDVSKRLYMDGHLIVEGVSQIALSAAALKYDHQKTTAIKNWKVEIAATDRDIPRSIEDIIDVLTDEQKAKLAVETLTKYNHKKLLRSQKPETGD